MIAIGSDHVGYEYKEEIKRYLQEKGYEIEDFGCYSTERTDYPVYGEVVGRAVAGGECECGILICGTGVGISLAANKVKGVRAVVCSDCYSAALSKNHNNTNILAMGARVVGIELAKMILDSWLAAEFEGGRHQKRIDMVSQIEENSTLLK